MIRKRQVRAEGLASAEIFYSMAVSKQVYPGLKTISQSRVKTTLPLLIGMGYKGG